MAPKRSAAETAGAASSAGGAAKAARQSRRGVDEATDRSIEEHFSDYSEATIKLFKDPQGKTLFERIAADKANAKSMKKRLSSAYWSTLRREFDHQVSAARAVGNLPLTVTDNTQTVDRDLRAGIDMLVGPNLTRRKVSRLCGWLAQAGPCNQRECVGLLRKVSEHARPHQVHGLEVLQGLMAYLARNDMRDRFPREIDSLRSVWDDTMVATWGQSKKKGATLQQFRSNFAKQMSFLVDLPTFDKVLAHGKDKTWSKVSTEVAQLAASSKLGRKMLEFAFIYVASALVGKFVDSRIADLADGAITKAWIQETTNAASREGDRLVCKEILDVKRDIALEYRGMKVLVEVHSLSEEVNFKLTTHVKNAAVGHQLRQLFWEKPFFKPPGQNPAKIDEDIIRIHEAGRVMFEEGHVVPTGSKSGELLLEASMAREISLLSVDTTMRLELAVLKSVTGKHGQAVLESTIMQTVDKVAAAASKSPLTALHAELRQLKTSTLYETVCRSAQARLDGIVALLLDMTMGVGAEPSLLENDTFLASFALSLQRLAPSQQKDGKALYGKDALLFLLSSQQARLAGNDATLDLSSCEPLVVFKFCLSDGQRQDVDDLVDNIVRKVATVGALGGAPKAKAKAKGKTKAAPGRPATARPSSVFD